MNKQHLTIHHDGASLAGWLSWPEIRDKTDTPQGLIVLAHGLSAVADLDLANYASAFNDAGFACLAYDHRNWGKSSGWPRCETDPWRQVADMQHVISYARALEGIDPERIGLWGTSYAGGHVLTVSALDRRVRCAVAQVPLVSGSRTFGAWVPAEKQDGFLSKLAAERDARARGVPPASTLAATPGSETAEWIERNDVKGVYRNELTLQSFDMLRSYEPIAFCPRIAPTPVAMIIADHDTQTPTAWQLEAFEEMREPKKLVRLNCRHYDVYMDHIGLATEAAVDWFTEHL